MGESTFTLDPAVAEDVADIVAFIRELAEYERLSHEAIATEDSIRQWLFGPQPAAESIIARVAGQPAGFALFFTTFSTFLGRPGLYLEDLFVRPQFRGAGIGKALLSRLAQIATERDYGRLEWAVLDWNEPAIGFYERIGGVAMNDWTTWRLSGERLQLTAQASG